MSRRWSRPQVFTAIALYFILSATAAAADRVEHARGIVTAVGSDSYDIHDENGALHVKIAPGGHLFRLVPAAGSPIRNGWAAHAIGTPRGRAILTTMLVLFPPSTAAGVPPASAGMTGIGTIHTGQHRLMLGTAGGEVKLILSPSARIVVATATLLSRLHKGDMAMAFGHRTRSGFTAAIVHIPPPMPAMGMGVKGMGGMNMPGGQARGRPAAGKMGN